MKITTVESWTESLALSRPYVIATRRIDSVELSFLRIGTEDGGFGLGSASPVAGVTGESEEVCRKALADLEWMRGRDARHLGALTEELRRRHPDAPAARAAGEMALYDLFCKKLGVPLCDYLGRSHESLPTSITIGIMSSDEALQEADEYLARGFRCLKVKIGLDLDADIERLRKLRERVSDGVAIRVDGNQGYSPDEALRLHPWVEKLRLELVEQPLPAAALESMRALPESLRRVVAADESLLAESDALRLAHPPAACGIFNIKLMKCGGITPALGIGTIAEAAGIELMWGCNDESAISIAAALHTAYASPATRYIDLDGSFDLARDVASGGFEVRDGRLWLTGEPGLGVALAAG